MSVYSGLFFFILVYADFDGEFEKVKSLTRKVKLLIMYLVYFLLFYMQY